MITVRARLCALAAATALAGAGIIASAGTAGAATPSCGNGSLAVSNTPTEGATGHGSFVLLFRNISPHTCTLRGYPGLDALSASGRVLAHARRTLSGFAGGPSVVETVHVAPGHFASATVEWLNFNPTTAGDCAFSTSVATTPANTTHTVRLPLSVSVCRLQIHPTTAGTSGNAGFAAAQTEWVAGARSDSAEEGRYWDRAKNDLRGTGYTGAIAELRQLISLPDADQTPTQNAEYHHDVTALDRFFDTPRLYL